MPQDSSIGGGDSMRAGGVHFDVTLQGKETAKAGIAEVTEAAKTGGAAAAGAVGKATEDAAEHSRGAIEHLGAHVASHLVRLHAMIHLVREALELGEKIGEQLFVSGRERAEELAETLKFESAKKSVEEYTGKLAELEQKMAAITADFEGGIGSRIVQAWAKVTNQVHGLQEEIDTLREKRKSFADAEIAAANEVARIHGKALKDEVEKAGNENLGFEQAEAEHEYRLKKLDERRKKEKAANQEYIDELKKIEDERWAEFERKGKIAAANVALALKENFASAVNSISQGIQSGSFGAGLISGDLSEVVEALGDIRRAIPRL